MTYSLSERTVRKLGLFLKVALGKGIFSSSAGHSHAALKERFGKD